MNGRRMDTALSDPVAVRYNQPVYALGARGPRFESGRPDQYLNFHFTANEPLRAAGVVTFVTLETSPMVREGDGDV
jgi:hypothetical protein